MDPLTILAAVTTAIKLAQTFIEVGKDAAPILSKVYALLSKGDQATQADIDELQVQSDAWAAEIDQPIPPEEE